MNNSEVLAVVGDREITRGDLEALMQSLNPQTARQFQSEEGRKNLLRELVNQELFYLDALNSGYDKDEEYLQEVERAKSNVLKQYALNKVLNSVSVTEGEIESFYTENKSQFQSPPSVKASHILVDDEEKAREIADEIKGGLSFEEAAKKHSKCPSSAQGGDLGYFSRGMMVPEFEKAAFEMEEGQLSDLVKTQFGCHLIKVYGKKQAEVKALEEVRDQIASQIANQKQHSAYQTKVNDLKGKYAVKLNI